MLHEEWYYILDDKNNPVATDMKTWAEFFADINKRRVAATDLIDGDGEKIRISTVFLGLDHNFSGYGPPLLFETMIFGGKHNQYQKRYTTWNMALAGHKKAVDIAKNK